MRATVAQAAKHNLDNNLCAGDFNVNIHQPASAVCALLEQTMSGLGFARLDMQGHKREWITRPRTGLHIDGILVSVYGSDDERSCNNRDWGTDDRTHLAMTVMLTTTVHPKTHLHNKDIRLCRI